MIARSAALCLLLAACGDSRTTPGDAAADARRDAAPDRGGASEARLDQPARDTRADGARPDAPKPDVPRPDVPRPDATKPDGGACKPYCGAVGSNSEGWYDGCTKQLMKNPQGGPWFDQCAKCVAACTTGSGGKGWYKLCETQLLAWSLCGSTKADGGAACKPYCGAIGSKSEGWYAWYAECPGDLIAAAACTP